MLLEFVPPAVHHLLEAFRRQIETGVCVEPFCQFRVGTAEENNLTHECQELDHLPGQQMLRGVQTAREQFPGAGVLAEPQLQFPVLNVTP